jgi:hypothetical protein
VIPKEFRSLAEVRSNVPALFDGHRLRTASIPYVLARSVGGGEFGYEERAADRGATPARQHSRDIHTAPAQDRSIGVGFQLMCIPTGSIRRMCRAMLVRRSPRLLRPMITFASTLLLTLLLLPAGATKLGRPEDIRHTLERLTRRSERWSRGASVVLGSLEVVTAVLLLFPQWRASAAGVAAGLGFSFVVAGIAGILADGRSAFALNHVGCCELKYTAYSPILLCERWSCTCCEWQASHVSAYSCTHD